MSDSSSEDENIKNLLESVDTDFINDNLFKKETNEEAKKVEGKFKTKTKF